MLTLKGLRNYNRYQAALGHLFFSLIIFAILGYLVYFCWYPQPLFAIDAGWQGLRILAFVDFVLGPFITVFIFNPKKKELFKDLAIIALIQISALSYGVYHVYQSRPAIVVYADNQFRTIASSQLEFFELPDEITNNIPMFSQKYFFLDIPRENIINFDQVEVNANTFDAVLKQYDAQRRPLFEANSLQIPYFLIPERLKPYQNHLTDIKRSSLSKTQLINSDKKSNSINTFFRNNTDALSITSVKGRFGYALVSLNEKGSFDDYLIGQYADTWLSK